MTVVDLMLMCYSSEAATIKRGWKKKAAEKCGEDEGITENLFP